jgi:flavin reductase (NADH)
MPVPQSLSQPARELSATQVAFRSAMANLSAAVNIVTTGGPHGRAGITVSAVCSVTDAPPTLLVCVNRASYTHDFFRDNGRVCVNVLGAGHEELAMTFAGRSELSMDERLTTAEWTEGPDGVPVLGDAVASLSGRVTSLRVQGSHTVMFVEVDQVAVREDAGGLVYFRRRFHGLGSQA